MKRVAILACVAAFLLGCFVGCKPAATRSKTAPSTPASSPCCPSSQPCPDTRPCPPPKPCPGPRPCPREEGPRSGLTTCPCGGRCVCPEGKCPNRCDPACCPGGSCYLQPRRFEGWDVGKITLGGQVGPDGKTEVQIDLPVEQRIRNIGSHVDGAGMCVSTSITHSARWHNMRLWVNFRDWCAKFPGGSYPQKTDRQVRQFAQEQGIPCPEFMQYEGNDPALIVEALRAGLLPAITYDGRDGVRYNGHIEHMVNVVYLDRAVNLAAIMDNNGKPEDLIWMSFDEFVERWTSRGRGGWVFLWLVAPPPPPPCN